MPHPTESFAGLAAALDGAQRSVANHDKGVAALLRLYADSKHKNHAEFQAALLAHVGRALVVFKREQAIERFIDFFAKLVAAAEKEEDGSVSPSLLNATLEYLLNVCEAKDKAVRFRACQTVSKLLNALDDGAEVDDAMWELLQNTMLKRVTDKIPVVRIQALNAVVRLQDPSDLDCPVIQAYMQRMECDSSPDVRKVAVALIALSKATIAGVLARRRDVKDVVRKAVFESLQEKLDLRALSIAQRVDLLLDGLRDRSSMVRQACGDMLVKSWLNLMGNNPETLLEALDVATRPDVCQLVADCLLERLPEATLRVEDFASLSPVKAFWWRCFVKYHKSKGNLDKLDELLPEVSKFAVVIASLIDKTAGASNVDDTQFVIEQLLQLSTMLDYTDEAGRRALAHTLRTSFQRSDFVARHGEKAMDLFVVLYPHVGERMQVINEILETYCAAKPAAVSGAGATANPAKGLSAAELRKFQVQLAGIRVDILSAQDEKEACVAAEDYAGAEKAKEKIAQLEATQQQITAAMQPKEEEETAAEVEETPTSPEEPAQMLASLTLMKHTLSAFKDTRKLPAIDNWEQRFILPAIQQDDAFLRDIAFKCLGLCCMFDRTMAQSHVLLFLQALQVDQEAIQITAFEIVVDLIISFGLETFSATEETEAAAGPTNILPVLERYLDSESDHLRTTAVIGFAKLLLLRRVSSVQLMSRLLLCYFNPTTADAAELRQCLAVFFPAFAFASRAHQDTVEQAFLPALRTIVYAPPTSPLAQVKVQEFIDMVMYLTSAERGEGAAQDLGAHDSLAFKLANEVLSDPNSSCNRALCKALSQLHFAALTPTTRRALAVLADQIVGALDDRHSIKSIEKLQESLAEYKDDETDEAALAAIHQQTEVHIKAHGEDLRQREVTVEEKPVKSRKARTARRKVEEPVEEAVEEADAPANGRRAPSRRAAAKSKKVVVEEFDEEEDEEAQPEEEPEEEEDDGNDYAEEDDEEEEDDFKTTAKPAKKAASSKSKSTKAAPTTKKPRKTSSKALQPVQEN